MNPLFIAAFLVCIAANFLYIRLARQLGVLDVPNARSSHAAVTPRGGGTVFITLLVAYNLVFQSIHPAGLFIGLSIAAIGYLDDLRGVSSKIRFAVHFFASASALYFLMHSAGSESDGISAALLLLLLLYSINTFNFIDGVNGLLALSCFSGFVWMLAASPLGAETEWFQLLLVMILGLGGFLVFNWSPARVFMGDVGSGFLGFFAPLMMAYLYGCTLSSLLACATLFAPIYIDCGVTLIQRLSRGENIFQAHRSHLYQRLSRHWKSHAYVSLTYAAYLNLVCGPLFYYSLAHALRPIEQLGILIGASLPIAICASLFLKKT